MRPSTAHMLGNPEGRSAVPQGCLMGRMGGQRGFTLVELMIVFAIIGILIVVMGFSFEGWRGRYRVEAQLRQMYSDFMSARARALQEKVPYSIDLPATDFKLYTIYKDAVLVSNTALLYDIKTDSARSFDITRKGLINPDATLRLEFENEPLEGAQYDCLAITATRINMGLYNSTTSECDEK